MANRDLTLALKITADARGGVDGLQRIRAGMDDLLRQYGASKKAQEAASAKLLEAQRHAQSLARELKASGVEGERFQKWMEGAARAVANAKQGVERQTLALQRTREALAGQRALEAQATAEVAKYNAAKARAVELEAKLVGLIAARKQREADAARAAAEYAVAGVNTVRRRAEAARLTDRLAGQFSTGDAQSVSQAGKIKAGVDSISASLARAQKAYLLFQGAQSLALSAGNLANLSDEYQNYTARLKLATRSAGEFGAAQADVNRIALASQSPIAAVAALYSKMSTSLREMGRGQRDTAAVVEAVALSLKISGASTAESSSAMLQLSQAFASGVLRGEEFNAMMENAPRLARLLADGLGVPVGQLRKMAEDGELTSAVLGRVFSSREALTQLRGEVAQLPLTIGGASQQLSDAFTAYIGKAGEASGATRTLAAGIQALAGNFTNVADAAAVGGMAALAVGVVGLSAKLLQAAKAAGTARLALLALSAHPLVLLATAAAAAGIALVALADDEDDLADARDKSASALGEIIGRMQQYASAQILAGDAVDGLTNKEVRGYRDRLQAAIAYHAAVREAEARKGAQADQGVLSAEQKQINAYLKALGDLKPILAARTKLETDHTAKLKGAQEELIPQLKAALDAQTKLYQDAGKAVEDIQKRKTDALKNQAAFQAELLAGPKKKPEEITLSDIGAGMADARQTAISGDPEAALKKVEALRENLRAMSEAGDRAAKDEEAAKNKLIELQGIAKTLEAIKIGIDQDAAEAALKATQVKLQAFADANPIMQRVIVQAQDKMLLDANAPFNDAPKKADGGLLSGPGSDTSDNLLAWLSPGEFIMRAAAVRQWGAGNLAAMNALHMPKFAGGGMAARAVSALPRFAAGGQVSAGAGLQPINLTIPGIGSYPMQASPDVADSLGRAIRMAALKRGSR